MARGRKVYFLTIDKAKFRKPAMPGDTIEYHVDKIAHRRNMWWYRAEGQGERRAHRRGRGRRHDCRGLDGDRSDRARRRWRAHWRGRGDRAVLPGRAAGRACKRRAPDRPCQRHRRNDDRRGHRGLSVLLARHAAAIGALSRRADQTDHRRALRAARERHHEHRHRRRRRRHAGRRPLLHHGRRPCRPRLPGRQRCEPGQQRGARRPRRRSATTPFSAAMSRSINMCGSARA